MTGSHTLDLRNSTPADVHKAEALSNDTKNKIAELIQKATVCWKGGNRAAMTTGLCRIAEIAAEAGDRPKAIEVLEQARKSLFGVAGAQQSLVGRGDAISADGDLSRLAASLVVVGSTLGDRELVEQGLGFVGELRNAGFRCCALSRIFGHLLEKGELGRSAPIKKRLLHEMDSLSGAEYCLAVTALVKILAKMPAAKDEVASLLETGLARAKRDQRICPTAGANFGIGEAKALCDAIEKKLAAGALTGIGIAYAKAARLAGEKTFAERARDIARQLDGADRTGLCGEIAVAHAALGLHEKARQYLAEQKKGVDSIQEEWDRRNAEREHVVANALVGVIEGDSTLLERSLSAADRAENRELAILSLVEALVDLARAKDDPAIAEMAGAVAARLKEPPERNCRLADRVGILHRSGRSDKAEALISQALSDVESVSDPINRGSDYLSIAEAVLGSKMDIAWEKAANDAGRPEKQRMPAAATASPHGESRGKRTSPRAPDGDLPLVEEDSHGYKNQLISIDDAEQRLALAIGYRDMAVESGSKEAVEAVLTSLRCDSCGEISIALACTLAHLPGPYAKAVRSLIKEIYRETGDSTFFGGMPLLRLAYIAALERDLPCLKEMAESRDGDNGVALVKELVAYVEGQKAYGVYRVMAWGEGLDSSFRTSILERLPDHLPGKLALIEGLTEAVAYIKRHQDYH